MAVMTLMVVSVVTILHNTTGPKSCGMLGIKAMP